jgi:tetratricopeptide (TPR) repeat protein
MMNHSDDNTSLGFRLFGEGKYEKAQHLFTELTHEDEDSPYLLPIKNALGVTYFMQRKYKEAEHELNSTLQAMQ